MRLPLSLSILAISAALPAFTQPQPQVPPLVGRTEVRLVNVDVTVTNSEGRPVSGLTQDDFEVFEDGAPQQITGFYAVQDAAVRLTQPQTAANAAEDFRRKFILMIDNNTVQKLHRDAAIEFVSRFLENDPPEASEWGVIAVGSQVETVQPFTTDKEAIRAALLKARRMPVFVQQREIDRDLLSDPGRALLRQRSESRYDFEETARFQSHEQTRRNLQATMNTARALIQTARAYSLAPGRKSLILLTGGIELNTVFGVAKEQKDPDLLELRRQMEQMLETMAREANAANMKIHVVKAGGYQNQAPQHDVENKTAGLVGGNKRPFFGEGFTTSSDSSNADSYSVVLALQTGGRYFPAGDVRQSLERIQTDSGNFYSLAFKPRGPEDARFHTLNVRVKRPELTVHHRTGYVALSQDQRLELALRSPLTFEKEKGDLPVTLHVGAAEKAGEKRLVPLTATIPLESVSLLGRGDQKVGRLHVYLAIYDDTGNNVGYHHRIQDVAVPASTQSAPPVTHSLKIALPKGRYTVAVTMRDEISNEIGTALKNVKL